MKFSFGQVATVLMVIQHNNCIVFNIHACTIDFCKNYQDANGCERLAKSCIAQNSTHNGLIFPSATPCACCEMCLTNLKQGDYCSKGILGAPMPDSICSDGLYCSIKKPNKHPTCQPMFEASRCHRSRHKFNNDLKNGLIGYLQQQPSCDGDGHYNSVTCVHGQNCFCQSENGARIFGDGLYQKNIDYIMHCGCSRLNDKLKDLLLQRFPFFTIRCKSDGSFDALQCIGHLCLCIDERTGSPTSDIKNLTMAVNATADETVLSELRDLPCYDEKMHLDVFNYARPCENLKRRLINTIFEIKLGEFIDAEVHVDICDPDGSYKSLQRNETTAFCVDRQGNQIEGFSVDRNSIDGRNMNCKCARARILLMDNNYLEVPECCGNGNYKNVQCRRGYCYCVDENGLQVSLDVIDIHKNKLSCFQDECK